MTVATGDRVARRRRRRGRGGGVCDRPGPGTGRGHGGRSSTGRPTWATGRRRPTRPSSTPGSTRCRARWSRAWWHGGTTSWLGYAATTGIAVDRTGALLVSWDDEQEGALATLVAKAGANGCTDVVLVDREEVRAREPHLGPGGAGRDAGPRGVDDRPVVGDPRLRHRGDRGRGRPAALVAGGGRHLGGRGPRAAPARTHGAGAVGGERGGPGRRPGRPVCSGATTSRSRRAGDS